MEPSPASSYRSTPTSVIVFGILNLLFGLFSIFGIAAMAILIFAPPGGEFGGGPNPFLAGQGAVMTLWWRVSFVLGIFATVALFASGIGLLMARLWAQRLAIVYAVYAIVSTIVNVVLNALFVIGPMLQQGGQGQDAAPLIGGAIGGLIGGCIGVIYPALLWYFLTRRHVVAALAGVPEMLAVEDVPVSLAGEGVTDASNPYVSPRTESAPSGGYPPSAVESVVDRMIPSKNGPALAAYYLGLLALFPCLGFAFGVAAVYLGVQGVRNVRANPEVRGGAHAWVGIICGGLFGLFNFVLLILAVVGAVAAASAR